MVSSTEMREGYEPNGAVARFSAPTPFTDESPRTLPDTPEVSVVWDPEGQFICVGYTGQQRTRLRQHLTGDRRASVLRKKIGEQLGEQFERNASRDDIREYLSGCEFTWRREENRLH